MTASSVKRPVRRSVAVLLPLSGATTVPAFVESALLGVPDIVGVARFVAAVAYLVASVGRQVAAAAGTPL